MSTWLLSLEVTSFKVSFKFCLKQCYIKRKKNYNKNQGGQIAQEIFNGFNYQHFIFGVTIDKGWLKEMQKVCEKNKT